VPRNLSQLESDRVNFAVFSPDGQSILTRTESNTAEVVAVSNGRTLARELNVIRAVFAPDGKSLFAGSRDGWVRVRSVDAGDGRRMPKPLSRDICWGGTAALSPDGSLIFVAGEEKSHIYRTDTWEPVGKPLEGLYRDYKDTVSGAAFSPDNRLLVTSMSLRGDGPPPYFHPSTTVTFWDVATTTPLGEPVSLEKTKHVVAFDPTGDSVQVSNAVFDAHTHSLRPLAANRIPEGHRAVSELLWYIDQPALPLWDNEQDKPQTVPVPGDKSQSAMLSADGHRLLLLGIEGMARLYDAGSGTPIGPGFQAEGRARKLSRDGRYALFASFNSWRLWDCSLGRPCSDPVPCRGMVEASFGPDGTILATHWSFSAHLWDCATGMMLGPPMELSSNSISQPIFTPDGRRLYLAGSGLEAWKVPPSAADDPERLRLSIEVRTGLEVDENSTIRKLSHADWLEKKSRLSELGGPCDVGE